MKQNNNPQNKAQELLDKFGLDDIIDIPMSDFVSGIDLIYMEEPLKNCDGKIIFGDKKTIIKVDSQIEFEQRKRFVMLLCITICLFLMIFSPILICLKMLKSN